MTAHLDAPALFPLKRRFTLTCVLAALRRDELELPRPPLWHGTKRPSPKAIFDELFERTQATVARIDKVVRRALIRQSSQDPLEQQILNSLSAIWPPIHRCGEGSHPSSKEHVVAALQSLAQKGYPKGWRLTPSQ